MIEKMNFINITGPKDDIDRVVNTYLSKYEIHLENALTELKAAKNLQPFHEPNPYKELLGKSDALCSFVPKGILPGKADLTVSEAVSVIEEVKIDFDKLQKEKAPLIERKNRLEDSIKKILPFQNLNYDIASILHLKYIKFRFGRIAKEGSEIFEKYINENVDTIFTKCHEDEEYISGVYFVPVSQANKIDAIYASMNFERLFLPDEYEGTPAEAKKKLEAIAQEIDDEILRIDNDIHSIMECRGSEIRSAKERLKLFHSNFDIRKMAACTKEKVNEFYILCGWMTRSDTKKFQKEVENDKHLYCVIEDDQGDIASYPPTKLKNPSLFKPFEMFIRMYGLPGYNEFDPTILVALTYSFFFGFMFGDVGQGICLFFLGLLLYRVKKMDLGAIISCAGVFSTIFGFLFGSVFGFEGIVEPLWIHPSSHMTNLPFIGSLNTVFVVAIAMGMLMLLFTMVLHIGNAIREHNIEGICFDSNGIAGLVFYGSLVTTILLFMTGNPLPGGIVLTLMFGLPLLIIALKEPLTALVEKKAEVMPKEKGMFLVQAFFELFELLMGYFSNTLSFIRIGALAVSHAAMMSVVMTLAGVESGSPNMIVIVIGNLFVMGLEGLIVGIQVLRLEYYEIFSRFYKGSGRAFKPYSKKI